MTAPQATDRPRRFRFRFGLKSIILLTFLLAIGLTAFRRYNAYLAFDAIQERAQYVRPVPTATGWWRLFDDSIYQVHHLSFHGVPDVDDQDVAHVAKLPYIRRLSLHRTSVTDKSAKLVSDLTKLEALSFQGTAITDNGLEHLGRLKNLKSLSLRHTAVTDVGLAHLSGLNNLEELLLDSSQITHGGIEHLQGMSKLKQLTLFNIQPTKAQPIPKSPWPHFANLSSLERLDVDSIIAEKDTKYLAQMSSLRELNGGVFDSFRSFDCFESLEELKTGASGSVVVEGATRLKKISVYSGGWSRAIKPAYSIRLQHLHALTEASAGGHQADIYLTDCRKLKKASLHFAKYMKVARLPRLEKLTLSGSNQINATQLRTLPQLKELEIHNCRLDTPSWTSLAESNQLRKLTMRISPIDEASAKEFAGITRLEELSLSGHSQIAKECHDLDFLVDMQNLQSLDVDFGHESVSRENMQLAMQSISKLRRLESLDLTDANLPPGSLKTISKLPNLKKIWFARCAFDSNDATHLAKLKKLETLIVTTPYLRPSDKECHIPTDVLTKLRGLRTLKLPVIPHTRFIAIRKLPLLDVLNSTETDDTAAMDAWEKRLRESSANSD